MTPGARRLAVLDRVDDRPAQAELARLLDDLATVILQTPDGVYTARPLPGVSGSIGEHVRHVLDHVAAFVGARDHAVLTYDHRERGTAIEADTGAALRTVMRLKALLGDIGQELLDRPIVMSAVLSRGGEPALLRTTRRRELAFVINHTVHHQALIAMLLALAGGDVPDSFGVAPTTPPLRS